jgi:protocatechuate 3,4-dioxygenase beta subunit
MTRSLALTFCLLSAVLLASAQDSMPAAKASSIAGTVMQEPGSQPLKKVLVQVVAEDQKQGGNYTATTDADGHFRVEDVEPGRYRIFIERAAFVGVNERGLKSDVNVVTIQAGQSVEDLLLRMLPTAVISGRVTDEDGDPMSGVRVIALRKKPGQATREAVGSDATNDLGEYRLAGLFPGQYSIMAMPPPDFRDYEK